MATQTESHLLSTNGVKNLSTKTTTTTPESLLSKTVVKNKKIDD